MSNALKPFKLTPLHIQRLQEAEKVLVHLESELIRARDAGLDVSEREEKFRITQEQVKGILRIYR